MHVYLLHIDICVHVHPLANHILTSLPVTNHTHSSPSCPTRHISPCTNINPPFTVQSTFGYGRKKQHQPYLDPDITTWWQLALKPKKEKGKEYMPSVQITSLWEQPCSTDAFRARAIPTAPLAVLRHSALTSTFSKTSAVPAALLAVLRNSTVSNALSRAAPVLPSLEGLHA